MAAAKLGFEDFIGTVDSKDLDFVTKMHEELTASGCTLEVKEAKSGFVVSYLLHKKTLFNYVFRKKGLIVRIYANHIAGYMEFLDTLPAPMKKVVQDAPACKRLLNPEACNSRCPMGYDFILDEQRYQNCRYSAFQFLLNDESAPYIREFIKRECAA